MDVKVPSVEKDAPPMLLTVLADDVRKSVHVECTASNLMALAGEFRRCIGRAEGGDSGSEERPRRRTRESPVKRVQFVEEKHVWKVRYTDTGGAAREKSFKVKAKLNSPNYDVAKEDGEREAIQFLQSNHYPRT